MLVARTCPTQLGLNHLVPGHTALPAAFRDEGRIRFGFRAPEESPAVPYPSMERADDGDGITAGRIHVACKAPAEGIEPRPIRNTMDWLDYYTHDGDPSGRFHLEPPLIRPLVVRLALITP